MNIPSARLLATAAALSLVAGCGKPTVAAKKSGGDRVQLVEVVPLVRRDLTERLTLVGSVAAKETAELRAEIAGVVRKIEFEEGSRVTKGQMLLKIDDGELQAQLQEAEATLKLSELSLERMRNLAEARNVTQADYDRANAEFLTAQARARQQRSRVDKTEVRAPFDGVAGGRTVSPGDYVNSQSSITTVSDISKMRIEFEVPEAFLNKVTIGTTFVLTSRAMVDGVTVPGEVYFVDLEIDRETRSSTVKGWLENPPPALKPGMFANVELILAVHHDSLLVPESALLVTREGTRITIVDGPADKPVAKFVSIIPGLRSGGMVEITSADGTPLDEGRQVIASGMGAVNVSAGGSLKLVPLRAELRPPLLDGVVE